MKINKEESGERRKMYKIFEHQQQQQKINRCNFKSKKNGFLKFKDLVEENLERQREEEKSEIRGRKERNIFLKKMRKKS